MDEGEITRLLRALTFYVQPLTPDASAPDTLGWIRAFFLWDENIIVTYWEPCNSTTLGLCNLKTGYNDEVPSLRY